jgi:hypothetical protein
MGAEFFMVYGDILNGEQHAFPFYTDTQDWKKVSNFGISGL